MSELVTGTCTQASHSRDWPCKGHRSPPPPSKITKPCLDDVFLVEAPRLLHALRLQAASRSRQQPVIHARSCLLGILEHPESEGGRVRGTRRLEIQCMLPGVRKHSLLRIHNHSTAGNTSQSPWHTPLCVQELALQLLILDLRACMNGTGMTSPLQNRKRAIDTLATGSTLAHRLGGDLLPSPVLGHPRLRAVTPLPRLIGPRGGRIIYHIRHI